MRVAILIKKAGQEGIRLSDDVAFFVAKHLRSNVRELEGALRKILAYSRFHGRDITIELTKEALKDLLSVQNRQISVENIPENGSRLLPHQGGGHVFQKTSRQYRQTAPDRHVPDKGTHAKEPSGNRRAVRRTRSYNGFACRSQNRPGQTEKSRMQSRIARAGTNAERLTHH